MILLFLAVWAAKVDNEWLIVRMLALNIPQECRERTLVLGC